VTESVTFKAIESGTFAVVLVFSIAASTGGTGGVTVIGKLLLVLSCPSETGKVTTVAPTDPFGVKFKVWAVPLETRAMEPTFVTELVALTVKPLAGVSTSLAVK